MVRTTRRRRPARRRLRKSRAFNITRKYTRKMHTLTTKRWCSYAPLNGSDAVGGSSPAAGISFKLSDLNNYTDFTGLFDQYMIAGIQYRWSLKIDPSFVTTAANRGLYPYLKWVHDHDDANVNQATFATEVVQYPQMKEFIFSSDRPNTRWYYLKPAVANSVYATAVTTGFAPMWRVYIDSSNYNAQHYGIKCQADQLYGGQQIFLETRFVLKLRGVI